MKPNDPQVLQAAGQFYAAKNEWPKAIDLLNKAVTLAKDNDTYRYSLAVALARSGRIEESLPHFVATVGDASAQYNIGYILYQQGRLVEAEQHLELAVQKRPELKQARMALAQVQKARKDELVAAAAKRAPHNAVSNADATTVHGDAMSLHPIEQTSGIRQPIQRSNGETTIGGSFQAPVLSTEIENWSDRK